MYRYAFWILPNCYLIGKIAHFNSKIEHSQKFKLGDINTYKYARNIHFAILLLGICNRGCLLEEEPHATEPEEANTASFTDSKCREHKGVLKIDATCSDAEMLNYLRKGIRILMDLLAKNNTCK